MFRHNVITLKKKLHKNVELMLEFTNKAHDMNEFASIQQRFEIMLIQLQNLEYDAESDETLKKMQVKFVKEKFFPFLKDLEKLEKENTLHEVVVSSLYYKQIKTNLIIKEIEHNKVEIENIVELESPRVVGMNESKKNMHLQKCVNTSVIDK